MNIVRGKNCELRGTDNVQGQIDKACSVYCPSDIFRNTHLGSDIPRFYLAHSQSCDAFRPIACEQKYLMVYKWVITLDYG